MKESGDRSGIRHELQLRAEIWQLPRNASHEMQQMVGGITNEWKAV
jgi:hypothetical protein